MELEDYIFLILTLQSSAFSVSIFVEVSCTAIVVFIETILVVVKTMIDGEKCGATSILLG